jgi:hypothetical protein
MRVWQLYFLLMSREPSEIDAKEGTEAEFSICVSQGLEIAYSGLCSVSARVRCKQMAGSGANHQMDCFPDLWTSRRPSQRH